MATHKNTHLVALLYLLLRDHIGPGALEGLVIDVTKNDTFQYSNRHLEAYAQELADRLTT